MSEFMKSVVEEVLKPRQHTKENPINSGQGLQQRKSSSTKSANVTNQGIPGIHRPNYQRDKIQKRLSVKADHVFRNDEQPHIKVNDSTITKGFSEGPLAKLQTMSLVQGNTRYNSNPGPTASKQNRPSEESKFLGQTTDGVKAWLFSNLDSSLHPFIQRPLTAFSIGVITSERCTVGQLFILNDILREFPSIKYFLTWDKGSKEKFVLEVYEQDSERLSMVVKTLYQKLSQKSYKSTQIFKVQSPSPWLSKQLELTTSVNGVAVIEGVDYYTSILLMDRHLKKASETNFDYLIEKNYLLLYGKFEIVSQVSEELKKEADRLN
ncbi:hypothetical protein RCG23_23770 [Neobacillus sp. PS3-34]|uniref:hypothetical protein n=1 Tax=Neobacillus sp. PS3-34 TaxID=3070678 RepID=UPI0027E121B4|nr:hypothetical protein [Neobacillus sp. PS3-34]WML48235.1 hypothetical protein RCG23_23770 [Neobacillus sp. PS3-34]